MLHFPRWKKILVVAICALGVIYAFPNAIDRSTVDEWAVTMPSWLPVQQLNLGLDLRGGSHLLLRVEYEQIVADRLEAIVGGLRTELRRADIGYTGLGVVGSAATLTVRDDADESGVVTLIEELDPNVNVDVGDNGEVTITFDEVELTQIRDNAIVQSIEIVRRRIDELGTTEPIIQRQGLDRILVQVPGIDDSSALISLLGQTARLSFHLLDETVTVSGPNDPVPAGSRVYPDNDVDANGNPIAYYAVERRPIVSGESLTDARPSFQDGAPIVSFRFDSVGARRFGETTGNNVGRRLAILLDEEIISAPVIRARIAESGIIEGGFTVETANELAILLRAGALPAELTVLEERTVGPGLGQDSIDAGMSAALIGLALVIVFMIAVYGWFGLAAVVALLINLALIMAALSLLQATLTLPGIAGIVLTVGMAVDANVLIFERIREEIRNGRTPMSAIDAGYSRAFTTIIDSNLTTLIAAILLFAMGAGPVRGFAVTLSIGILASMFTAIMVTRLMIVTWLMRARPKTLTV